MEISTVLIRSVVPPFAEISPAIEVRPIAPDEIPLWSETTTRGWSAEHPELRDFLLGIGPIMAAGEATVCFLATIDGQPGAAGVLRVYGKTALFGGAATVPEMRRRGLQGALLGARMRWAQQRGCDVAMMVAATGSDSQRNAERIGFRIAYTRTKWRSAAYHVPIDARAAALVG